MNFVFAVAQALAGVAILYGVLYYGTPIKKELLKKYVWPVLVFALLFSVGSAFMTYGPRNTLDVNHTIAPIERQPVEQSEDFIEKVDSTGMFDQPSSLDNKE